MTKRPFGHGPFQWMGNFKAVAMDYEYYLSLENIGRLYCLTDREVYVLMVQLTYVGWLTRWYNTDDITQTTVGYIQSELMEKLMSCVDIQVLIDQAKLNLVDSVTHNQIEAQALRDILEDRYDGDPTSINPSAPTTNFGSSGDRFDALCAGLMAFVYQFARAQADSARAAQVGGLLSVALIAALLIPGLNFFFLVGASIAVVLGLGTIGVSLETAIAALTDTTALDAVVCYMRDTLKAQSVTEANWTACLDSYPFGVGTHEAIICDFIKPTLASNYLTILNILGQAYDGTINGDAMPECPCEPEPTDLWVITTCIGDVRYGIIDKISGPTSGPGTYEFKFTGVQYDPPTSIFIGGFRWGNSAEKFVVNSVSANITFDGSTGTPYTFPAGSVADCGYEPDLVVGLPVANSTTPYGGIKANTYAAYPWEITMNITVSAI